MELLKTFAVAVALAGCYSPDLRDCAVFCSAETDCGPGQVCGSDGMCAAPAVAGQCGQMIQPHDGAPGDAAVPPGDGPRLDAFVPPPPDAFVPPPDAFIPPPDAQMFVNLVVVIKDKGRVDVAGIGSCTDMSPMHTCTFSVPAGIPRTLHAVPGEDRVFDKWEAGVCIGSNPTCVFTPTAPSLATAKFKHD